MALYYGENDNWVTCTSCRSMEFVQQEVRCYRRAGADITYEPRHIRLVCVKCGQDNGTHWTEDQIKPLTQGG